MKYFTFLIVICLFTACSEDKPDYDKMQYHSFRSAGLWGFLNEKGDTMIPPKYKEVNEFKPEGTTFAQDEKGDHPGRGLLWMLGQVFSPGLFLGLAVPHRDYRHAFPSPAPFQAVQPASKI